MTTRTLLRTVACGVLAAGLHSSYASETEKPDAGAKPADTNLLQEKAESPAPKPAPEAKPEKPAEVVAKATVSADAQKLLDQMSDAYGKLKSLELVGVYTGHFDAAGQQSGGSIPFTASFQSPNKFRHAGKDDILVGSNGEKAYAFSSEDNMYAQTDSPKEKIAGKDLPIGLREVLSTQNPSLKLALAKDPSVDLTEEAKDIAKAEDTKVGDLACPTLKLTLKDDTLLTLALDPQSHLIRRTSLDMRRKLENGHIPDVKEALCSVDYTTTSPDAAVATDAFVWAPPVGAKDLKDVKELAAGGEEGNAVALTGKDAPDFTLTLLDGKEVNLKKEKGKVIILDFWATWCPPCRAGLPHLDAFYQSKKADGLEAFAVNLAEEKETVKKFVDSTKLGVPVLLDSKGETGEKYKAEAIPETILIGKDGKVILVIVGNDDASTEKLHKAATEALKK